MVIQFLRSVVDCFAFYVKAATPPLGEPHPVEPGEKRDGWGGPEKSTSLFRLGIALLVGSSRREKAPPFSALILVLKPAPRRQSGNLRRSRAQAIDPLDSDSVQGSARLPPELALLFLYWWDELVILFSVWSAAAAHS